MNVAAHRASKPGRTCSGPIRVPFIRRTLRTSQVLRPLAVLNVNPVTPNTTACAGCRLYAYPNPSTTLDNATAMPAEAGVFFCRPNITTILPLREYLRNRDACVTTLTAGIARCFAARPWGMQHPCHLPKCSSLYKLGSLQDRQAMARKALLGSTDGGTRIAGIRLPVIRTHADGGVAVDLATILVAGGSFSHADRSRLLVVSDHVVAGRVLD